MFSLCGRHPCTSGGRHPHTPVVGGTHAPVVGGTHAPVVGGTPMHQWWEAPPCTSGGRHPHAPVVGGTPMHQWWEAPMYQWWEAPPCTSGGRHPHAPVVGGDCTSAAPPIQLPSLRAGCELLSGMQLVSYLFLHHGWGLGWMMSSSSWHSPLWRKVVTTPPSPPACQSCWEGGPWLVGEKYRYIHCTQLMIKYVYNRTHQCKKKEL